jgi:hypothetical protein
MESDWTAEITNDPERDMELYIELLQDGEYRGRIYRDDDRSLKLKLYPTKGSVALPLKWLVELASSAELDLEG